MIALTKKQLLQFKPTRLRKLHTEELTCLGYKITPSMYRNRELVLVTTDTNQDCIYKELAPEQRHYIINYYQSNYSNVSQYKTISNSRGRFLTMLEQPIELSQPKLVEVKLPC